MAAKPVFNKQVRMSPPLGMDYWQYLLKEAVSPKTRRYPDNPKLVLRGCEPVVEYQDTVAKLQVLTDAFVGLLLVNAADQEKPSQTLDRLRNGLDKKYKLPVLGLYYFAVGDSGASNPSNAMALYQAMEEHNELLSKSWDAEYPDKPNLFAYITEMYELGVWPKGFRVFDGVEKFMVDVPLTFKKKTDGVVMLGCWAHGDTDLHYMHSFYDDCRFNIHFEDDRPERVIEEDLDSFFVGTPPLVTI